MKHFLLSLLVLALGANVLPAQTTGTTSTSTTSSSALALNGQVVIRDRMKITMSCDHRVVDGALGAEYLRTLRSYLEQPVRLVL